VWFVHEVGTLLLLPNQGFETNWYKNMLANPILKVSVNGVEMSATDQLITDRKRVDDIVEKFQSKYGRDVKRYYSNFDVALKFR
jgi:hypothetical protein